MSSSGLAMRVRSNIRTGQHLQKTSVHWNTYGTICLHCLVSCHVAQMVICHVFRPSLRLLKQQKGERFDTFVVRCKSVISRCAYRQIYSRLQNQRRCKSQTVHLAPTAEGATPYVQLLGPTVPTSEDGITGPAAAVRGGSRCRGHDST